MIIVVIATVLPWEVCGEGGEEVVDGPGDDDVVVDTDEALGKYVGKAHAFEQW